MRADAGYNEGGCVGNVLDSETGEIFLATSAIVLQMNVRIVNELAKNELTNLLVDLGSSNSSSWDLQEAVSK